MTEDWCEFHPFCYQVFYNLTADKFCEFRIEQRATRFYMESYYVFEMVILLMFRYHFAVFLWCLSDNLFEGFSKVVYIWNTTILCHNLNLHIGRVE